MGDEGVGEEFISICEVVSGEEDAGIGFWSAFLLAKSWRKGVGVLTARKTDPWNHRY